MIPQVDTYFQEGCMRCPMGATPDCKVHRWVPILEELRRIILACGLTEAYKWSQPCYTYQGKNVLILTALKNYACIGFFKGSLLQDPEKILISPGKYSQSDHRLAFTEVKEVLEKEAIIKAYIFEAIEIEKAGLKVEYKKEVEPIPEELQAKFDEMPELKAAFEALTPGRQRGYILYFSGAKQSNTRTHRIKKYIPKILSGKGFHDR